MTTLILQTSLQPAPHRHTPQPLLNRECPPNPHSPLSAPLLRRYISEGRTAPLFHTVVSVPNLCSGGPWFNSCEEQLIRSIK